MGRLLFVPILKDTFLARVRQNIITGMFVAIPVFVTIYIIQIVLGWLTVLGKPAVDQLFSEAEQSILSIPVVRASLAVLIVLSVLYSLGWFTRIYIGQKFVVAFDNVVGRIPMVKTVYGATKQFMGTFQAKPEGSQRVVLVDFGSAKVIGLLMHEMPDPVSKEPCGVVLIPAAVNPTSGLVQLVPMSKVVVTELRLDETMTFLVSGGSVPPKSLEHS
jgi:uncharacterized membrane protein